MNSNATVRKGISCLVNLHMFFNYIECSKSNRNSMKYYPVVKMQAIYEIDRCIYQNLTFQPFNDDVFDTFLRCLLLPEFMQLSEDERNCQ